MVFVSCRGGSHMSAVSPEGGAPKGVSPRVFLNLKRTHEDGKQTPPYINNSLLISSLLVRFVENIKFAWGTWANISNGESSPSIML
jgi:hypothetical protein